MNPVRNGLLMRKTEPDKEPTYPRKSHFHAIFPLSS
jgi:hypothetical protein